MTIEQWGDNQWLEFRFVSCINLTLNTSEIPDLSKANRFSFSDAESFNGDISAWEVGNISDMSFTFQAAKSFNGDISNWDVSSVTDMTAMFSGAALFKW